MVFHGRSSCSEQPVLGVSRPDVMALSGNVYVITEDVSH
jgi:hypothetical protein